MRTIGAVIALVGAAISLVIHLGTFVAPADVDVQQTSWVHIFAMFVLAVFWIWTRIHFGHWPKHRELTAELSPRWRLVSWALAAYTLALFAWLMYAWSGGTLGEREGRAILHSHGRFIRYLTSEEVESFQGAVTRLFSSLWMLAFLGPFMFWSKHEA